MEKSVSARPDTIKRSERDHTRPDTKVRGGRHERSGRHRSPTRGTISDHAMSIAHSFVSVEPGRHARPSVFRQENDQLSPPIWRTSESGDTIRASDLAASLSPNDRAAGRHYPPSARAEELREERLAQQGDTIRASDLAASLSPNDRAAGRHYPPSARAEELREERLAQQGGTIRASDYYGLLTQEDISEGRTMYPRRIPGQTYRSQEEIDLAWESKVNEIIREVGNISLDAPDYMDQQRTFAEYGANLPVFLLFSVVGSNDVWAAFKTQQYSAGRHHQEPEHSLLFAKFDPNTRRFDPDTQRELVSGKDGLILEHNTEGADPISVHLHLDEFDNVLRFRTDGNTELHVLANPGDSVDQEDTFANAA